MGSMLTVRLWGLVRLVGGFAAMVPVYFGLRWLGEHIGHVHIEAIAVLPMVISMQGWFEVVIGIPFLDLAQRFELASGPVKFLILIGFLILVGIYLAGMIWFYNRYA